MRIARIPNRLPVPAGTPPFGSDTVAPAFQVDVDTFSDTTRIDAAVLAAARAVSKYHLDRMDARWARESVVHR